jgi:hypothetical protein
MVVVCPASSCSTSCVLRAIRAEKSVGRAIASSNELVCRLCVCPQTAASASITVRGTLVKTSCAASDQPLVWVCARTISERGSLGEKCSAIRSDQSKRAARCLAISMKAFMPEFQKKETRRAKASTSNPAATPVRTYSMPSARV